MVMKNGHGNVVNAYGAIKDSSCEGHKPAGVGLKRRGTLVEKQEGKYFYKARKSGYERRGVRDKKYGAKAAGLPTTGKQESGKEKVAKEKVAKEKTAGKEEGAACKKETLVGKEKGGG
eukprot:90414_1